jgi:LPXTG-site transpeptidase (sortase) family protein
VRRALLGTVLERVGLALLLLCAVTLVYALAYPRWAEWEHERQQPLGPTADLAVQLDSPLAPGAADNAAPAPRWLTAPPTEDAAASAEPPSDAPVAEEPQATLAPFAEESAAADPEVVDADAAAPSYGRAVRMQIPRIRVNSSVLEVGIANGEYQVPGWEIGHHADSPDPGTAGNSVFNGHLETINAGRVFARLKDVRVGDAVYIYTDSHRLAWVVQAVRTVPDTDYSFVLPTADTRITLYTCAGRYNPVTRAYTHWLVVVGKLVDATPITP